MTTDNEAYLLCAQYQEGLAKNNDNFKIIKEDLNIKEADIAEEIRQAEFVVDQLKDVRCNIQSIKSKAFRNHDQIRADQTTSLECKLFKYFENNKDLVYEKLRTQMELALKIYQAFRTRYFETLIVQNSYLWVELANLEEQLIIKQLEQEKIISLLKSTNTEISLLTNNSEGQVVLYPGLED